MLKIRPSMNKLLLGRKELKQRASYPVIGTLCIAFLALSLWVGLSQTLLAASLQQSPPPPTPTPALYPDYPPIEPPTGDSCIGSGLIQGVVVDPNGQPVSGAYVSVNRENGWDYCYLNAESDANGAFVISNLAAGDWIVWADPGSSTSQFLFSSDQVVVTVTDGATTQLPAPLQLKAPQLSGTLLLPDGAPAAWASGRIQQVTDSSCDSSGVPGPVPAPPPVMDPSMPVPTPSPDDYGYYYEMYFSANEQGHWGLIGVESGAYCLYLEPLMPYDPITGQSTGVLLNPPAPLYFVFDSATPTDLGSLQYRLPAKRIEGTVRDQNGAAVAGVNIQAYNNNGYGWLSTVTDANGQHLLQVYGGEWSLSASLPSNIMGPYPGPETQQTVTFAMDEKPETAIADFTLEVPTSSLGGRIVDVDGNTLGAEVASMNVSIESNSSEHYGYNSVSMPLDAAGRFSVRLFPGDYTVRVYIDTYMFPGLFGPTLTDVAVGEDQALDLGDIRLQGPQVSAIAVRPDGQPMPGLSFTVNSKSGESCVGNGNMPPEYGYPLPDSISTYGNADENGVMLMGGLPAGDYCFSLSYPYDDSGLIPPAATPFTVVDGGSLVDLGAISLIEPPKTISGRVQTESGAGVANAYVSAYGAYGWDWYGGGNVSTTTDADGNFTLMVGGGTWNVNVSSNDGPPYWSDEPTKTVIFADDNTPESRTITFTVQLPDATVSGRVLDPDGNLLQNYGVWVDLYSDRGYSNSTGLNEDGTFSLPVIAGTYQLFINVDMYSYPDFYVGEQPNVQVSSGQTVDLGEIRLSRKSAVISGTVLDDVGQPVANAAVNAWSYMGESASAVTGPNGVYSMTVRAGQFDVAVSSYDYPPAWFVLDPPVQVTAVDNQSVTADFTVYGPAGTISGIVVDDEGNLATDVRATAYARRTDSAGYGYFDVVVDTWVENGTFALSVPQGSYQIGLYLDYNGGYSFAQEASADIDRMQDLLSLNSAAVRASSVSAATIGASIRLAGEQPVTIANQPVNVRASQFGPNVLEDAQVQIVVKRNDAIISGHLVDPDGTVVTDIYGDVSVWSNDYINSWINGPIDGSTGRYELMVAEGTWNMEYWLGTDDYLANPMEPLTVTAVSEQVTEQNITLQPLNGVIEGTVLNADGSPLAFGYAWANAISDSNVYVHGTGAEVVNGHFTMKVLTGVQYSVGVDGGYWGPNPGQAAVQTVTVVEGTPALVTLQLRSPDSQIVGTVTQGENGEAAPGAYIYAWSDAGQNSSGEADATGAFTLDVYSGSTWHVSVYWYPGSGPGYYATRADLAVDLRTAGVVTANPQVYLDLRSLPPSMIDSIDVASPWTASLDDGTRIDIPAGALPVENLSGDDVTITVTPLIEDLPNTYTARPIDYGYGIYLSNVHTGATIEDRFNLDVTLTFYYTDQELADLGITEADISPAFYSTTDNAWRLVENFTVTPDENRITAQVNHFSKWALVVPSARAISGNQVALEPAIFMPVLVGGN